MNRRLLFLVNSPALLLGLGLIVVCGISVWTIGAMEAKLQESIQEHATRFRATQAIEVAIHRWRFDALLARMEPSEQHWASIESDHKAFDQALQEIRRLETPEEASLIEGIEQGYLRYQRELQSTDVLPADRAGVLRWIEKHPIQHVIAPCRQLLEVNQREMESAIAEGLETSDRVRAALFLFALIGPAGGLICGFSIDRLLSRSIARLQVLVQDVHSHVAPEVRVVDLNMGKGFDSLHDHLDFLADRVGSLVERLQTQQREIIRSEQLALAGQLASGIAHEIRNPLTSIRWLVEGALTAKTPDEQLTPEDLRVMQGEVLRAEGAVQGLLDYVRATKMDPVDCDLRDVVLQVVELTRARRRQTGVTCALHLAPEPVTAFIDPGQIKSVVINLLQNALDEMPQGGHIDLRVKYGGNAEVQFVIEDTGGGISPEVLGRLFDPFTSTKPNGTGLGLNLTRRIIEEHGGRLTAENRAEGGARFTFTLPARSHRGKCGVEQGAGGRERAALS